MGARAVKLTYVNVNHCQKVSDNGFFRRNSIKNIVFEWKCENIERKMEENKVKTDIVKEPKFSKKKIAKFCLIAAIGKVFAFLPVFSMLNV